MQQQAGIQRPGRVVSLTKGHEYGNDKNEDHGGALREGLAPARQHQASLALGCGVVGLQVEVREERADRSRHGGGEENHHGHQEDEREKVAHQSEGEEWRRRFDLPESTENPLEQHVIAPDEGAPNRDGH